MDSDWLWVMLALGIFLSHWHAMLAVGGAGSAVNGVSARSRNLTYEAVIGPQRS
jgi:hypothetical protein